MTTAFTASQFTSPDIRPTGPDSLAAPPASTPDLDMEEIRAVLYAALHDTENLPALHPDS